MQFQSIWWFNFLPSTQPDARGGVAFWANQNMSSIYTPSKTEQKIKEIAQKPQPTKPAKTYTQDELFKKVDNAVEQYGMNPDEAMLELLNSAKSKWYAIEWYDIDSEIKALSPQAPQEPQPQIDTTTFLWKLEQAGRERMQNTEEIQSSDANFFSKQLQLLWQKAGAFSDIVWAWVSEALSTITPDSIENKVINEVSKFMQSQWVQDKVKTAKEVYDILPESVQKNVEALWNIGLWILDIVWAWQVAKIAKPVATAWVKTTGKIVSWIAKAPITWLKEWFKQSYWFDADTISQVLKNNTKFKELQNLPIEEVGRNVADDVVKGIETRLDDLSEVGKGYESVKKWAIITNDYEVQRWYLDVVNKVEMKQLTKADKTVLKDAVDYIKGYKWDLTDSDVLALRKQLDSVLYDPNTWLKRKLSPQWERIIQWARENIDNIAKERITGLKELDAQFAPEKQLLTKVKWYIYAKDGSLKDNYIQTISNITGKGKEIKLEMLEKINPDLSAQVKMYKALQDIDRVKEWFKVGTYRTTLPWIAWAWVWFAIWWPVWAVVWPLLSFMIFNPTTWIKILNTIAKIERGISGIVWKVKNWIKLTTEELSRLIEALESNLDTMWQQAKTKVWEWFDTLADKTGARVKFIDDTKGTWISGKIEAPKELIDEARKYKSADEFIKNKANKGDILLHWTDKVFDSFDVNKIWKWWDRTRIEWWQLWRGIYFTDDYWEAVWYAKYVNKQTIEKLKYEDSNKRFNEGVRLLNEWKISKEELYQKYFNQSIDELWYKWNENIITAIPKWKIASSNEVNKLISEWKIKLKNKTIENWFWWIEKILDQDYINKQLQDLWYTWRKERYLSAKNKLWWKLESDNIVIFSPNDIEVKDFKQIWEQANK